MGMGIQTVRFLVCGMAIAALAGCGSGSSTPTSAPAPSLTLTAAAVLVGGQTVSGMTLPQGHGQGMATRFEARMGMNGTPLPGAQMWMQYQRPGGMMGGSGTVPLYDDGTHGDRTPGDGLYCLEDAVGTYGCHAAGSPMGQYHYEFWGSGSGYETNHQTVTVTIAAP